MSHDLGRWEHLPAWLQLRTRLDPLSLCWVWTRDLSRTGHPRVRIDGKRVAAHRFIYQYLRGPLPDPKVSVLDHLCRNRACVNPWHLEAVTPRENTRRGVGPTAVNAEKQLCKRGHPYDDVYTGMGRRDCRVCRRERAAARKKKKKTPAVTTTTTVSSCRPTEVTHAIVSFVPLPRAAVRLAGPRLPFATRLLVIRDVALGHLTDQLAQAGGAKPLLEAVPSYPLPNAGGVFKADLAIRDLRTFRTVAIVFVARPGASLDELRREIEPYDRFVAVPPGLYHAECQLMIFLAPETYDLDRTLSWVKSAEPIVFAFHL